jgi:hypothetical protein
VFLVDFISSQVAFFFLDQQMHQNISPVIILQFNSWKNMNGTTPVYRLLFLSQYVSWLCSNYIFNRIRFWKNHQMSINLWVPSVKISPLRLISHAHLKVYRHSQSQRPSGACHCILPCAQRCYFYSMSKPSHFKFPTFEVVIINIRLYFI